MDLMIIYLQYHYQSFWTVSCLSYHLLQSIWIFGEICHIVILLIHMFISLSRQCLVLSLIFFSQFGFEEICLIVISLIRMFISLSRQFLVLSMIFSQFGFLEKSVLLESYSSAYKPVFPGSVLSLLLSVKASRFPGIDLTLLRV